MAAPLKPRKGKPVIRFEWKDGGAGGNAEALGNVYLSLQAEKGLCTPEDVVEVSRNPNAPTHRMFEWDDPTAGELWRVHQARRYLGSLVIVEGEKRSRVVHVTTVAAGEPLSGYLDMRKASTDHLAMERLAQDCYSTLKGWRQRAAEIEAFKGVWEALDELDPPA